jgi:gamma-glutamylcyclotransferase
VVLEALVYVDLVTEEGSPRTEYIGRMNAALRDAGLSPEYVAGAVRRFIPPEG